MIDIVFKTQPGCDLARVFTGHSKLIGQSQHPAVLQRVTCPCSSSSTFHPARKSFVTWPCSAKRDSRGLTPHPLHLACPFRIPPPHLPAALHVRLLLLQKSKGALLPGDPLLVSHRQLLLPHSVHEGGVPPQHAHHSALLLRHSPLERLGLGTLSAVKKPMSPREGVTEAAPTPQARCPNSVPILTCLGRSSFPAQSPPRSAGSGPFSPPSAASTPGPLPSSRPPPPCPAPAPAPRPL